MGGVEEEEKDLQRRVEELAEQKLRDPVFLQRKLGAVLEANRELKERQEQIFGSDRSYSMARVAEHLELEYFDPSDELQNMGQNILHRLFVHDSIIVTRGAEGYRLASRYEKKIGKTISHVYTTKRGVDRVRDSVQFNGKGLEYLMKRYRKDSRIFRMRRWAGVVRFTAE